jgi:hypothetical protein
MDRPGLLAGAGLPFRFHGFAADGAVSGGVPASRRAFAVAGDQEAGRPEPADRYITQ